MENIAEQKQLIVQWINSVNDPKIIAQLDRFRHEKSFDFEKELARAITADELKKRTTDFIYSLDWKK